MSGYSDSKKYHFLYRTTNLINGRFYIGMHSTDDLDDGYLGAGNALLKAVAKYGRENFKREILAFYPSREELAEAESNYVNPDWLLKNAKVTYNIYKGGYGGIERIPVSVRKRISKKLMGHSVSERTRRLISKKNKGRPRTAREMGVIKQNADRARGVPRTLEVRAKISKAHKGVKKKPEAIEKMRKKKTGVPRSEETKKKLSLLNSGQNHPQYGKPKSKETRRKIAETLKKPVQIKGLDFPCAMDAALFFGVCKDTINRWRKKENESNCVLQ